MQAHFLLDPNRRRWYWLEAEYQNLQGIDEMTLSYESQTCSRCAGTGRHSFNQISGSVCFGCNGAGVKDTKRGAATRLFMNELLETEVSDLSIGDRFTMPRRYRNGRFTVAAISAPVKTGRSRSGNGPWSDSYGVTITTIKNLEINTSPDDKVRRLAAPSDILAGIEYQNNLTKAGTPRKRKVA